MIFTQNTDKIRSIPVIQIEPNRAQPRTSFSKEEAHDLAYSELYTRCRSIAGALAPCGVSFVVMLYTMFAITIIPIGQI